MFYEFWTVDRLPLYICVNCDNKIWDPNAFYSEFVFPFLFGFRFILCYRCSYDASQEYWMKRNEHLLKVACCCYANETDAKCNESNKWTESELLNIQFIREWETNNNKNKQISVNTQREWSWVENRQASRSDV